MKGKLNENGIVTDKDSNPFRVKNDPNRLENFKKYDEFLHEEELKFSDDNQDIFNAIYDEIDNIQDVEKQKSIIKKLDFILNEN